MSVQGDQARAAKMLLSSSPDLGPIHPRDYAAARLVAEHGRTWGEAYEQIKARIEAHLAEGRNADYAAAVIEAIQHHATPELVRVSLEDRTCHYCLSIGPMTHDHIVPLRLRGRRRLDGPSNGVPACQPCNIAKGNERSTCDCPDCLAAWQAYGPPGWEALPRLNVALLARRLREEPLGRAGRRRVRGECRS